MDAPFIWKDFLVLMLGFGFFFPLFSYYFFIVRVYYIIILYVNREKNLVWTKEEDALFDIRR